MSRRAYPGDARKLHADADTRLIGRQWYVAAWSEEIGRTLTDRWILGKNLLLYRTRGGDVVALQNRCAHRSFPLSKGYLDGDRVVCGYHGLTYDSEGRCVRVPSAQNRPADISVMRYPVVERRPYVWVWMGGAAHPPDEASIPAHSWLSDDSWDHERGYLSVDANYLMLLENLMDLTHFSYLQAGIIGTKQYAEVPFDVQLDGATVRISRLLRDDVLPEFYAGPMGLAGIRVERASDSFFLTPGFQLAHSTVTAPPTSGSVTGRVFRTTMLHAITPSGRDGTHYFWAVARDYEVGNRLVSRIVAESFKKALEADRAALEAIARLVEREQRPEFREANLSSDRASLAMRQIIQELAELEVLP